MFGSLKHKLSRKEKKNDQYQPSQTPATRRPPPSTPMDAPPAYTPADRSSFQPSTVPAPVPINNADMFSPNNPFKQSGTFQAPPSPAPAAATPTNGSSEPADDAYAFLSTFDTAFLIDDSGSMAGSRWRETGDALEAITPVCTSHDADGIDLHFLNNTSKTYTNITSAADVHEIFSTVRPAGMTPTGQRLRAILKPYIAAYTASPATTKPLNLICITDGAASDDVESVVVWAARALDKLDAPAWQVGVQFFQVGRDREATADLEALDDEISRLGIRDMVDTVPFRGADGAKLTGGGVLKVVLGSVNRKLDRRPNN